MKDDEVIAGHLSPCVRIYLESLLNGELRTSVSQNTSVLSLRFVPGLQPGCRIAWEQVRSHVLCATSCVTAYELGKSGNLAKLLSIHLQHLISRSRNWVQRSCNLIVKGWG